MSDLVSIQIRLHLPGARVGEIIAVDPERADRLVNAKYAIFVDAEPERVLEDEPAKVVAVETVPTTELPAEYAVKGEWIKVAENLGIDTEGKTKDVLIDEVTAAVGG